VVSTAFRKTRTKERQSSQFHHQCEGVHHIVNSYLRRVAPHMAEECKKVWDAMRGIPVKDVEKMDPIKSLYHGHAVHFNKDHEPHVDQHSCWAGFDAIAPFGSYSRGFLEFPDLGIRIPSRAGDLFFIRGAALHHNAGDWTGEGEGEGRMVFAFFSQRYVFHIMTQWSL